MFSDARVIKVIISSNKPFTNHFARWLVLFLVCAVCAFGADTSDWVHSDVDWRMPGGDRIKAIRYPAGKKPVTRDQKHPAAVQTQAAMPLSQPGAQVTAGINIIDSPPVDGFVPLITVIVTNARGQELELETVQTTSVTGGYPPGYNPQTEYTIGIFDTGASAHVMGNTAATQSGLFAGDPCLVTNNIIDITGVNDSTEVLVSQPMGIFVDGINAIDGSGNLTDMSGMVGQTNVSIVVGMPPTPPAPDLPTAIGSPLSVYFTAVIRNDQQISVTHNSEVFTGPAISFYEHSDPAIPTDYPLTVPLELKPLGGISVQYIPDFDLYSWLDDIFNLDFDFGTPSVPSTIIGNLSQSVFFVHSVDMSHQGHSALDRNRFLFDTGAQVTVVGSRVGARLGLDPADPAFEVEIQGVTGETATAPGFLVDSLQLPALGRWLSFTNAPVILLDVASPEGGTVDGIIGMNLFVNFNLVLRGGGLFLTDDPRLELEPLGYTITGDFGPADGDGIVNTFDLAIFSQAWLSDTNSPNWNPKCDIAPLFGIDNKINHIDFALLARHWLQNP